MKKPEHDPATVKAWFNKGVAPEKIAWIFLVAELTERDPNEIKAMFEDLHDQVKDTVYGTQRSKT